MVCELNLIEAVKCYNYCYKAGWPAVDYGTSAQFMVMSGVSWIIPGAANCIVELRHFQRELTNELERLGNCSPSL